MGKWDFDLWDGKMGHKTSWKRGFCGCGESVTKNGPILGLYLYTKKLGQL